MSPASQSVGFKRRPEWRKGFNFSIAVMPFAPVSSYGNPVLHCQAPAIRRRRLRAPSTLARARVAFPVSAAGEGAPPFVGKSSLAHASDVLPTPPGQRRTDAAARLSEIPVCPSSRGSLVKAKSHSSPLTNHLARPSQAKSADSENNNARNDRGIDGPIDDDEACAQRHGYA